MRRAEGVACAGGALLLAALLFDASILFVPAVALLALGLLTPVWIRLAARGTTVHRVVHANRVIEDQPLEATIVVRRGLLGSPGVEVLDPLAGGVIDIRHTPSATGRIIKARVVARFPRRGRRHFDPPTLSFGDPLGLVQIVLPGGSGGGELLVLPRTEPVRRTRRESGAGIDAALRSTSIERLAATDVDGLRPYQRGTPASRISWPALARGAGLLERRMRADPDTSPLVVLDARCSGPEEHVDAAVRAAASLTLALARSGGCDLLLPGDRRPVRIESNLSAWNGMHVRLALVEGGPDAPAPWLNFRSRVGRVFYVAAEANRLPAALRWGDQRVGVLVLPLGLTPSGRHEVSFEVTGCRGYVLGQAAERRARERAA